MKHLVLIAFVIFGFTSCSKEDELKNIEPQNKYDVETADYATLKNITMKSCDVFTAEVVIKVQNLPQNINFSHVIIENQESKESRITNKFDEVYLETSCNQEVVFYIYLYEQESRKQTPPSIYILKP